MGDNRETDGPRERGQYRLRRFASELRAADVDVALLTYPVDVYYLAGTPQPSTLLVTCDGSATLLVSRNLEGARQESWVGDIGECPSFKGVVDTVAGKGCADGVIGICGDVTTVDNLNRIRESFPRARFVDVATLLRKVRMIKDEDEIRRIREAARIADIGHSAARRNLRPGVSELQLAGEIELEMIRAGGDGYILPRNLCLTSRGAGVISATSAYPPGGLGVTISGKGSTPVLPFGPSRRILQRDDVVVVDLGGVFQGYVADEARTYVLGKASREQERMVQSLRALIERGLELLTPGVRACDVYEGVRQLAVDAGYGDYFMGPKERNIRFIGHGVGLELDELPVLYPRDETVLAPGMVIAFEPILMIPDVAVATLENTILITPEGHEVLTKTPMEMVALS